MQLSDVGFHVASGDDAVVCLNSHTPISGSVQDMNNDLIQCQLQCLITAFSLKQTIALFIVKIIGRNDLRIKRSMHTYTLEPNRSMHFV